MRLQGRLRRCVFSLLAMSSGGRGARAVCLIRLPAFARRWRLDFVVVNGENAAGGFGLTEPICEELLGAGVDSVTLGNHAFDQREALVFIQRQPQLFRPVNYPAGTPGRGASDRERGRAPRAAGRQCPRPRLHGCARRSVRGVEPRVAACPLGQGVRRLAHRLSRRGVERERGLGSFRRRTGRVWSSARIRMFRPPTIGFCAEAPGSCPTSA